MSHVFYRTCTASLIACVVLVLSACQSTPPRADSLDTYDYVGSSSD